MSFRDQYGASTGSVDSDGTVRNEYGAAIGKIYDDGTVRNEYGAAIGSASGVSKNAAAYRYFFSK